MEILMVNKSSQKYYDFPLHKHGYWEIIVNLCGNGNAIIEDQVYPFTEGTIFCVPPGTTHKKVSEQGFYDGCIFIKDFTPVDNQSIGQFEDDINHTFQNLLSMAFDIQNKNEANAKTIVNSIGDVMYQLLLCWSTSPYKKNSQIETFRNILSNNITNCNFDISSELTKTGYCNSYFRKLFKGYYKYSPVNYMNHLRIEYAKKQLQQYHDVYTIKEIASRSGFSDPYYFSRVFKQYEGVSPQLYIKNLGVYDHNLIAGINYPNGV